MEIKNLEKKLMKILYNSQLIASNISENEFFIKKIGKEKMYVWRTKLYFEKDRLSIYLLNPKRDDRLFILIVLYNGNPVFSAKVRSNDFGVIENYKFHRYVKGKWEEFLLS